MRSLNIPETKMRLKNVRTAYKPTFHWLFDPEVVSFSDWLATNVEQAQPFYWIQGKPGSGKSTLMKFAMNDPRMSCLLCGEPDLPWTVVSFFFHDRGSSIQKSLRGMLQEVIYCIIVQLPHLASIAIGLYADAVKAQGTESLIWEMEVLTTLMHNILGQRKTRIRLMIMLDALDEHEGDNGQLIEILNDWSQRTDGYHVTLKICLASRPWPAFSQNFGRCPNFAIHKYTGSDVRIYTESRLKPAPEGPTQLLSKGDLASLVSQITTKARESLSGLDSLLMSFLRTFATGPPFKLCRRRLQIYQRNSRNYTIIRSIRSVLHMPMSLTSCFN